MRFQKSLMFQPRLDFSAPPVYVQNGVLITLVEIQLPHHPRQNLHMRNFQQVRPVY